MATPKAPHPYVKAMKMVKNGLAKRGVVLKAKPGKYVDLCGDRVKGYFESHDQELHVGLGAHPFIVISTLLHEYAHVEQWSEAKRGAKTRGAVLWRRYEKSKHGSYEATILTLQVELDAERRTVRYLKQFGIGTKRQQLAYVKEAALYVMSHHVTHREQSWFKRSVCLTTQARAISRLLPSSLRGGFLKRPEEPLYSLIASWLK